MAKLRILQYGRFNPRRYLGGVQAHAHQLCQALAQDHFVDNLVSHTQWKEEVTHEGNYSLYEVPSLGIAASTALSPMMLKWSRTLRAKNNYDIVHLHFPDPLSLICALTSRRSKDTRTLVSWHSDVLGKDWALPAYLPLLKKFFKQVDAVILPTPGHGTGCKQHDFFPLRDRFFVVPYGVDLPRNPDDPSLEAGANEIREKLQIDVGARKQMLFFMGRHVPYKGIDRLIQAFSQLPKSTRDRSVLVLAGDGPLKDSLREKTKELGIEEKVRFPGSISDSQKFSYFKACDVFCLPSVTGAEAFGLVQVEAMACRKPVICFDLNNGVTHVNQHMKTGLVVPLEDVAGFSVALDSIIKNDDLRKTLGHQARDRVMSEFTIDIMKREMLKVYESLLQSEISGVN